jgi:hypothetical protein
MSENSSSQLGIVPKNVRLSDWCSVGRFLLLCHIIIPAYGVPSAVLHCFLFNRRVPLPVTMSREWNWNCLRKKKWGEYWSLFNNQPDALIIQILFCHKTLHVSGIFSPHHQEFSTVYSTMVSYMQIFDDRFQADSGWNCISILTLLGSGHQKPLWNSPVPNVQWKNPYDVQRVCPKHVEFYNRINLDD